MASRMSEKEKMYFFVLLIPILWPLGLAMLLCDIGEAIRRGLSSLYRRTVTRPDHGEGS
jgi:hypothetical protein